MAPRSTFLDNNIQLMRLFAVVCRSTCNLNDTADHRRRQPIRVPGAALKGWTKTVTFYNFTQHQTMYVHTIYCVEPVTVVPPPSTAPLTPPSTPNGAETNSPSKLRY